MPVIEYYRENYHEKWMISFATLTPFIPSNKRHPLPEHWYYSMEIPGVVS